MLTIEEVLELVDLKMEYGTDCYSQKVFKTLDKKDERMHVVPSKAIRRYMYSYIKSKFKEKNNNESPVTYEDYSSIIKIVGDGKARKYEKKGILLMLEDEKVNKLIQKRLLKNTYLFKNDKDEHMLVPNFVWEYYSEKSNGIFKNIEQAEYYVEIKDDPTDTLKMKLFIIQQEINKREAFEKMILEYDEVAEHRSPESLDYGMEGYE